MKFFSNYTTLQVQSQGKYEKYIVVKPPEIANFLLDNQCIVDIRRVGILLYENVDVNATLVNSIIILAFLKKVWYTIIIFNESEVNISDLYYR